jgi:hypothetical protein
MPPGKSRASQKNVSLSLRRVPLFSIVFRSTSVANESHRVKKDFPRIDESLLDSLIEIFPVLGQLDSLPCKSGPDLQKRHSRKGRRAIEVRWARSGPRDEELHEQASVQIPAHFYANAVDNFPHRAFEGSTEAHFVK